MVSLLVAGASLLAAAPVTRVEVALGVEGEKPRMVKLMPGGKEAKLELGLGEEVQEYRLVLARGVDPANVKIEGRIVSSVSVGAEGPHWDLIGWRDGVSEWKEMKLIDKKRLAFKLEAAVPPTQPYTREDVNAELKRIGEEQVLESEKRGETALTLYSGVSRYEVRVSVKEGAEWKAVHTFSVHPPMGC